MRIPHPISHLVVADVIAQKWGQINEHFGKSGISMSKCKIVEPETEGWYDRTPAVYMTPHRELKGERLLRMSGYGYILKTDISRCFPSIYTHSIAWALHTKPVAKARENRGKRRKYLGVNLDDALRSGNDGQTSGIPVGPGTSHVVSEIIMSAIDEQLQNNMKFKFDGYRHVDDYFLCFNSYQDAKAALTEIKKAAADYELAVNDIKTEILQTEDYSEGDMWTHRLRELEGGQKDRAKRERIGKRVYDAWWVDHPQHPGYAERKQSEEKRWLMQFASEAFDFAKAHPNKSVMKYALAILRELPLPRYKNIVPLRPENWDLYESILIRIMTAYPYTADKVAAILCECGGKERYSLLKTEKKREELSAVLSSFIGRHAPFEHHTETAWGFGSPKFWG